MKAIDLAKMFEDAGVAAIIYTDIHRDGTMQGPNLEALRELAESIDIPVIASGGVSSVQDLVNLLKLEPIGVTGAIVGRAIYTGDVDLAWVNGIHIGHHLPPAVTQVKSPVPPRRYPCPTACCHGHRDRGSVRGAISRRSR